MHFHRTFFCLLVVSALVLRCPAKQTDIDSTWVMEIPDDWQRKSMLEGEIRSYTFGPSLDNRIKEPAVFMLDPAEQVGSDSPSNPGFSISFGRMNKVALIMVQDAPNPKETTLSLFGKAHKAIKTSHTTSAGKAFVQYAVVADLNALPHEGTVSDERVIVYFVAADDAAIQALVRIFDTMRLPKTEASATPAPSAAATAAPKSP